MIIVESIEQLSHNPFKSPFALIPTMGNLHSGHINLLNLASNKNYNPVVSIFVNPLQFGPSEDLETYPRSLEQDLEILKEHNCHGVFVPKQEEILKNIENLIAPMSNKLCGKSRPGHFDGVITIVNRLFEVTKPEACVFGMKDFQQQLIIKHLIRQKNMKLNFYQLQLKEIKMDWLSHLEIIIYKKEKKLKHLQFLNLFRIWALN